ncbi:basic proline-rich protein-like [Lathamus discolor]|uniref:basic proline-rich protein-like n=1 Tax=Lathamus discolor TaxID=678569 RepID=UPI0032B7AAF5
MRTKRSSIKAKMSPYKDDDIYIDVTFLFPRPEPAPARACEAAAPLRSPRSAAQRRPRRSCPPHTHSVGTRKGLLRSRVPWETTPPCRRGGGNSPPQSKPCNALLGSCGAAGVPTPPPASPGAGDPPGRRSCGPVNGPVRRRRLRLGAGGRFRDPPGLSYEGLGVAGSPARSPAAGQRGNGVILTPAEPGLSAGCEQGFCCRLPSSINAEFNREALFPSTSKTGTADSEARDAERERSKPQPRPLPGQTSAPTTADSLVLPGYPEDGEEEKEEDRGGPEGAGEPQPGSHTRRPAAFTNFDGDDYVITGNNLKILLLLITCYFKHPQQTQHVRSGGVSVKRRLRSSGGEDPESPSPLTNGSIRVPPPPHLPPSAHLGSRDVEFGEVRCSTPNPRSSLRDGGEKGLEVRAPVYLSKGDGGERGRVPCRSAALPRRPPPPSPGKRAPRQGKAPRATEAVNKEGERPLHVCWATTGPALRRESRPGPLRADASRAARPGERDPRRAGVRALLRCLGGRPYARANSPVALSELTPLTVPSPGRLRGGCGRTASAETPRPSPRPRGFPRRRARPVAPWAAYPRSLALPAPAPRPAAAPGGPRKYRGLSLTAGFSRPRSPAHGEIRSGACGPWAAPQESLEDGRPSRGAGVGRRVGAAAPPRGRFEVRQPPGVPQAATPPPPCRGEPLRERGSRARVPGGGCVALGKMAARGALSPGPAVQGPPHRRAGPPLEDRAPPAPRLGSLHVFSPPFPLFSPHGCTGGGWRGSEAAASGGSAPRGAGPAAGLPPASPLFTNTAVAVYLQC